MPTIVESVTVKTDMEGKGVGRTGIEGNGRWEEERKMDKS